MIRVLIILLLFLIVPVSADTNMSELQTFLEVDKTDEHEYLPWYSCGHFSRDLVHNASEYNITLGSAILSNHPVFRGKWNSHIINYIKINGTLYFIEPYTDEIMELDIIFMQWKYVRLYPDGTQVPSYWDCNLAPSVRASTQ